MRDAATPHGRLESLFGRVATGWVPAVDLYESTDRYVLSAEVPGLSRADIQIEFHDGALTVRGERSGLECAERFHQLERGHGLFARTFRFTLPIDADAVTADLTDGVLTIILPKTTTSTARRIDVG
jgi:HSP20 family protein